MNTISFGQLACWILWLYSSETDGFAPQCHRRLVKNVFSSSTFPSLTIGRTRSSAFGIHAVATEDNVSTISNSNGSTVNIRSPQLVEFREPSTNVTVVLVGAMHYNPTSVQLAQDTVVDLGVNDRLGSVVVESCDIRWNKTGELVKESDLVKNFLTNEMRTAADAAEAFGRPVVLGDQRINITVDALKDGFRETLGDLFLRPREGWPRVVDNIARAKSKALPERGEDNDYLGPVSFFDSRLLLAAPVSLVKYPLSYFFRSPLLTLLFTILLGIDLLSNGVNPADLSSSVDGGAGGAGTTGLSDVVFSLAFAALEILVFARILLKELLAERNEILAKNILEQCKIYAKNDTKNNNNNNNPIATMLSSLFSQPTSSSTPSPSTEIVYSDRLSTNSETDDGPAARALREKIALFETKRTQELAGMEEETEQEKVVVAILGMAHCNGITKLLKEQSVA